MSGALAGRSSDREQDKGRVEKTKVQRYWAGKLPGWAEQPQDASEEPATRERARTEITAPVVVKRTSADDPRMRRLAQNRGVDVDRDEALERRREIRQAEIVRRPARHGSDDERDQRQGDEEEELRPRARSTEPGSGEEDAGPSEDQVPRLRHREPVQPAEDDEEEVLKRRQAVRERCAHMRPCALRRLRTLHGAAEGGGGGCGGGAPLPA
jgi:hypothetical protein